eukprot:m.209450 g.209450  ORF g.209450 m.209450 type:complete len:267 (+) comp22094_c10_seq2:148-948(+)
MSFTRPLNQITNSRQKAMEIAQQLLNTLQQAQQGGPQPHLLNYFSLYLSEKILARGPKCKRSSDKGQHTEAFALALVVVLLWAGANRHGIAGFAKTFLGAFTCECPYILLIPDMVTGQTAEDYRRTIGYRGDEKMTVYMDRMQGLLTLYAAVMQTESPAPDIPNPYGLEQAWTWLARILNGNHIAPFTAMSLSVLLDTCSHALAAAYGRQFVKALQLIQTTLLPKLERLQKTEVDKYWQNVLTDQVRQALAAGGRLPPPAGRTLDP